jgi:hypothetical protein
MNLGSSMEVKLLIAAVILGLVHLVWASVAGAGGNRDTAWLLGPRDDPRPVTGQAARLSRAYANFLETFPLFAVVIIAVVLAGKTGTRPPSGPGSTCSAGWPMCRSTPWACRWSGRWPGPPA